MTDKCITEITQDRKSKKKPKKNTKAKRPRGRPRHFPLMDCKVDGSIRMSPNFLLSKKIQNLDEAIQQQPIAAVENILTNSVAVLTIISNTILKEACGGDGQILDSNSNVKKLLKDKNYLAFSTAQRQAASQLLALQKYKDKVEAEAKKEAAKQKRVKPAPDDLDVLLS